MRRIIVFLGALLLVGSGAAALGSATGHNPLVIPRTDLTAAHTATPAPSPATGAKLKYPPRPVHRPTPVSTPSPTATPSASPAPILSPVPSPTPFPTVAPKPPTGCGQCGAGPIVPQSEGHVMCPMYCVE